MIPEVRRQLVDGVTVLSASSPSGWQGAMLMFRVGRFDETLPASGITHLVAHLAFSGPEGPAYPFNAEVNGRFTTFFMESSAPADVADFVATVCRGLAGDHSARLEQEKRVLRTEAVSRNGAGVLGSCLVERYGAAGPGLAGYEEYGLRNLVWEQVAAWRSRWFTAENAVLCLFGDVPVGLHIDLPHGRVLEMPVLRPCPVQLPAFAVTGRGGIGMSLVGSEAVANTVALDILQRRLTDELRHNRGLSYSIQGATEHLGAHVRHTWLAADTLPEQAAMTGHVMLGTFEKLAGSGCTPEELAGYSRRLRDAYQSPGGPVLIMRRQATQILCCQAARDPGDTLRLVEQVTCGDVASAASSLFKQMIVATPQLIPAVQGRMPRLPLWSTVPVAGGVTYRRRDSAVTLTMADGGVMVTAEPGKFAAVRSDQVAALLRWSDAKLTLIGTDGFVLQLDPADWDGAGDALQVLANRTDPDLVVTIDAPGPARGKPADPDPSPTGPVRVRARRKPRVARRWLPWIVQLAWILALTVAALEIGFDYRFSVILFLVAFGSCVVPYLIRRRKRPER